MRNDATNAMGYTSVVGAVAPHASQPINTAKTQLHAMIHKTATHRQANLLRLLNAAPRLVDKSL